MRFTHTATVSVEDVGRLLDACDLYNVDVEDELDSRTFVLVGGHDDLVLALCEGMDLDEEQATERIRSLLSTTR